MLTELLDLLFPPACIFCRQPLLPGERQDFLCFSCQEKKPFFQEEVCPVCAATLGDEFCCSRDGAVFSFAATTALGWYRGDLKQCLHEFKYKGKKRLSRPLGELLVRQIRSRSWKNIAAVVPVPLHQERLQERGYNQSYLLASEISQQLSLPLQDIVRRTKNTPPQTKLSRWERLHNLKGAFQLQANILLRGETLLLVDDVFTTGTTLQEVAQLLLAGGAGEVYNAVLAR